jgi:peptide/nickel transport system ATP-binding protein
MRLVEPSEGSIRVEGTDVAQISARRLRPLRKRMQIVFQDPFRSLNPRRAVLESVIEGMRNFGVARTDAVKRAKELLDLVGIDPATIHQFPHQFSGGQRQRICIARALALDPEVLIADEAVSALDVSIQAQVLNLLKQIGLSRGIAILFITHDLRVAAQICDTIAVMQNGRIVESGPAFKVLTSPKAAYTRELLDAAPARNWDFQAFRSVQAL